TALYTRQTRSARPPRPLVQGGVWPHAPAAHIHHHGACCVIGVGRIDQTTGRLGRGRFEPAVRGAHSAPGGSREGREDGPCNLGQRVRGSKGGRHHHSGQPGRRGIS